MVFLARSYINLSRKTFLPANICYADSAIKYANLAMTTNADNATVKVAGGLISGANNYLGSVQGNNFGCIRQGDLCCQD